LFFYGYILFFCRQKEWDMCNHFEEWIKTQPDKEHALKEFYAKCGIKY
ncbi:hypothetical protein ACMYI0_002003, partial [Campylobacter jejuni]